MRARQMRVSPSVVSAELDGEGVLLNVETGVYFGLGEAEQRVWALLAQGTPEAEILRALAEEYDAGPGQLRADLSTFLDALAARRLIEIVG